LRVNSKPKEMLGGCLHAQQPFTTSLQNDFSKECKDFLILNKRPPTPAPWWVIKTCKCIDTIFAVINKSSLVDFNSSTAADHKHVSRLLTIYNVLAEKNSWSALYSKISEKKWVHSCRFIGSPVLMFCQVLILTEMQTFVRTSSSFFISCL
jgi:hypothetical protein